jgi:hypothetical protein
LSSLKSETAGPAACAKLTNENAKYAAASSLKLVFTSTVLAGGRLDRFCMTKPGGVQESGFSRQRPVFTSPRVS